MTELFHEAFSEANFMYTLLLLLIIFYWFTVIIGALDLDFLNFEIDGPDVELDVDVEVDMDVDADADTEVEGVSGGFFFNTLAFFNVGKVPFMVFLSMLVLSLWAFSVVNHYSWGNVYKNFFVIWFVPNFLISLLAAKLLTQPFKGSFEGMNKGGKKKKELVGKIGEILIGIQAGKIGRLEVYDGDEHFTLDVTADAEKVLTKGQKAIIVEYDSEKDLYVVESF